MPRAGWSKPDANHRLSDHLAFAVLMRVFPPDVVDQVLADVGRVQLRTRMLPSRTVVYYVLGLALFSQSSYDEVIRLLIAAQAWSSGWAQSPDVPTKAALYKARLRLGHEPLQALFERVATPIATARSGKGFYSGWRVLGCDVVSLDVPSTPANRAEFENSDPTGESPAQLPSVRVLGLIELGTGAIVGASIGHSQTQDACLVANLLPNLGAGQLILGSREPYSIELWAAAAATGADLLWEIPADMSFAVGVRHADNSYTSRIDPSGKASSPEAAGFDVRVLEDPVSAGGSGSAGGRRFVTTIQDSEAAPSSELMALFTRTRSLASAFDEFNAHRNSAPLVLRSKIPDGVRQELYGYLCAHYAMRWVMNAADAHNPAETPWPSPQDLTTTTLNEHSSIIN